MGSLQFSVFGFPFEFSVFLTFFLVDPVLIPLVPEKQGSFDLNDLDASAVKVDIFFLLALFYQLNWNTFLSITGKIPCQTHISEARWCKFL